MSRVRDAGRCGCLAGCLFALVGLWLVLLWLLVLYLGRKSP